MHLAKQKIDIEDVIAAIKSKIEALKQDEQILKRGIEEIDKGFDMFNGNGVLASEVRSIMRKNINK